MHNWKYTASVIMITIVIMSIGGIIWNSGTIELEPVKTIEPEPDSVTNKLTSWQRGNRDAPVTIDIYMDLGCHICIENEAIVLQALNAYPGKLRVIHHHYPSSGFYEKLAESLEAAGEQGKFWEFHDQLIQNIPDDMTSLFSLAEDLGLDIERFSEAINSGKYTETVRKAKEEAIARGVKDVSMFINGEEYDKSPDTPDDLYNAIDNELEKFNTNGN